MSRAPMETPLGAALRAPQGLPKGHSPQLGGQVCHKGSEKKHFPRQRFQESCSRGTKARDGQVRCGGIEELLLLVVGKVQTRGLICFYLL